MEDEREKETEEPDVEGDDDTPDVEAHRWGHGK